MDKAKSLFRTPASLMAKGSRTRRHRLQQRRRCFVAQYVQDQGKKNLSGISMTIQSLDPGSWFGVVIAVDPASDWGDAPDVPGRRTIPSQRDRRPAFRSRWRSGVPPPPGEVRGTGEAAGRRRCSLPTRPRDIQAAHGLRHEAG